MNWTVFVLLRATPQWLSHTMEERNAIASEWLGEAMTDARVQMQFYDAEAFSGRCSDVAVFETEDLQAYYFTMERLRNTTMIAKPYFDIVDIIPAIKDGFQTFQQAEELRGA